ncbi:bifunctional alpha,alpha-trehalose-phosphate synthase (UDP-forming)/trehalose-phosphatase [Bdellovibrio sp. SKB1291214]|uniref:bifunctional alpha,alpha-trehalose-phosphate synthase (UDP-forming)/trehalose-phosphatase n=1 Tax=Bdellovibrio sp. SKB1291214 TaxID=1732569 RepID=UPI00223FC19C|nr:bifunctional alpha,alpha-trehalose-phosphate synthase (UDP-forming)/trehalose-phosphatase [Bdellovibrio sp. SKB1291214]UYL10766.1 bifunctional alpha,alpha-trehalose-phosphate synthase (UDP-forming)/trehalose-phosphatase [Bdellovibrio sp. SKB1291214]
MPQRIFVSNRLPYSINENGELKRGSGGLVSALMGVSKSESFSWFGFETDENNALLMHNMVRKTEGNVNCYPVYLDKEVYDKYYNGFANDILWPLFHYESHLTNFDRKSWECYREANQVMAQQIAEIAQAGDTVWIHDFHFFLLPKMLRELCPGVRIGFFLHIPFPAAELFRQIPVREELLDGVLACDLIGFHEHSYLRQFIVTLKMVMGVDANFIQAQHEGHRTQLGVYPISIESDEFKEKAESDQVRNKVEEYRRNQSNPFVIVGVDRLDYSKGLELKLRGFQHALDKYPELRGQISLLQIAIPTREDVPAYMNIRREVEHMVGSITGAFGTPSYNPVHYVYNSVSETELLALYRSSNAILVTSKRDGMNLVAMEYVMAQDLATPGSLILSEFAGAASLLSDALLINPWDVDSVADAIKKAFDMSFEERNDRMSHLQEILSKYSSTRWAKGFLADLEATVLTPAHKPKSLSAEAPSWSSDFTQFLTQRRLQVLLDYDGTLVPIAKRPEQAQLSQETRDVLTALAKKCDLYILSGRNREFLDAQFAGLNLNLSAEHGAFVKLAGRDWNTRISSDINSWYPHVEKIMSDYAEKVPLSFVERKNASLVWHFRLSPPDFAAYHSKKMDEELQLGMSNQPVTINMGKMIVEAKALECNKGNFVRWLQQRYRDTHILAVGDDRTDEDMFAAVADVGLSVKVGDGVTIAQYRLKDQKEVVSWLRNLADKI